MTILAIAILAVADWLIVGQWVFNVLVSIGLAYIASKNRQVENLQAEVKEYARQQVKSEVALLASEMRATLAPVQETLRHISERLGRGDAAFDQLWDGDRQMELKLAAKMETLKDWMREQFAARDDQHAITETVNGMRTQLVEVKTIMGHLKCQECGSTHKVRT